MTLVHSSFQSSYEKKKPTEMALRRSAAVTLAAAVMDTFPDTLLVKSDVYGLGFYYDFVFSTPLNDERFSMIEERMRAITKECIALEHIDMMRANARLYFIDRGQIIKGEILAAVDDNVVEMVRIGSFMDLCLTPYALRTDDVAVFKLNRFYF